MKRTQRKQQRWKTRGKEAIFLNMECWNKTFSKPIMRDIWHSELINGTIAPVVAHWDKLRPVTTMQMQSHAPADRCTSFLPNAWASEIISTFHLLGRIWFIKLPPITVLIYKANWGVRIVGTPPRFVSYRLIYTTFCVPHCWVLQSQ